MPPPRPAASSLLALLAVLALADAPAAEPLRYNRDIRPILSDNCFSCHGPDVKQRKSGLRLDVREEALKKTKSGKIAIVPGAASKSALWTRINSPDKDEVMPPPKSHKTVTAAQKKKLRLWIERGANYEQHWSFAPLAPGKLPVVKRSGWPRSDLDRFILARLEAERLAPSPEAPKETLIRRVSLDLTGLPPTPQEVAAFLADTSDKAYEKVVERLLKSPHYGERMAVDWLDAARFADSNGYQVDRDRELWPWRDWVIRAFNDNQRFDQFTIEQLAGDLLPGATLEQRIATGFHRNHMMNEEGGIIAEEFLAEYTADRVETTAAVWLGQTFNCCRCHDHKFDPFTQRDFYSLKAFFHNIPELGVGLYGNPIRQNSPPFVKLPTPEIEARIAGLNAQVKAVEAQLTALAAESLAGVKEWAQRLAAAPGTESGLAAPTNVVSIARKDESKRTVAEQKQLAEFRLSQHPEHRKLSDQLSVLKPQVTAAEAEVQTTLVMEEMKEPRPTFVLMRGGYDKPGERVTAATPAALPALAADQPRNRLGLARWLVSPENPLTARVTVNRLWQQVFGTGLVKTSEDFGAQGAPPTHPELLDWLADQFIRSGWDVKHLMKLMVTSATYRQQARLTPLLRERDPENRLLARGPRYRLMGEFVRDQALAASGLLVEKIGGPSVKPYHPAGLYEQITAGTGYNVYVPGKGDDLHRRSLYTYWKRSVPNPAMLLFDAPFREACTLRRPRTNTPLQALNLMNDPTYVEASRFLAQRMMRDGGEAVNARLTHGFRLLLARPPRPAELAVLRTAYERAHADFASDRAAAKALLGVGEATTDAKLDPTELAAFTAVASTLLNLDEVVTRE
jgi:hypothetical protein